MKEKGPKGLGVSGSSSERESSTGASARASRPPVTRTPPGVWPQVSQADMGRVVRRLRVAAERVREQQEPSRMRRAGGG
ncbi:hypothetical protein [Melittangium boletus]|nr:hypothetical protein [Melittangium boletus]